MDSTELAALKGKRSTAQALFSKRDKKLSVTVDLLEKRALINKIRALGVDFGKLHNIGLDYVDALGEVEGEGDELDQAEEKIAKCLAIYTEMLQLCRHKIVCQQCRGGEHGHEGVAKGRL